MDAGIILPLILLVIALPALLMGLFFSKNIIGIGEKSFLGGLFSIFRFDPDKPWNPLPYTKAFMENCIHALPDSLIIGTGILALLLQNFPLFILLLTMMEIILIRLGLGSAIAYSMPSLAYGNERCRTGIRTPILETLLAKLSSASEVIFPSGTLFIFGAILSYVSLTTYYNYDVLKDLGSQWEARAWIGPALSMMTLVFYGLYRLVTGCESMGMIAVTLFLSIFVGGLLVYQNAAFFGPEAVNLLGLPYLDSRLEKGSTLFVCSNPQA
jgi:hypothetical protein